MLSFKQRRLKPQKIFSKDARCLDNISEHFGTKLSGWKKLIRK